MCLGGWKWLNLDDDDDPGDANDLSIARFALFGDHARNLVKITAKLDKYRFLGIPRFLSFAASFQPPMPEDTMYLGLKLDGEVEFDEEIFEIDGPGGERVTALTCVYSDYCKQISSFTVKCPYIADAPSVRS